jgi:ribonucleotide reductase alpha subunit
MKKNGKPIERVQHMWMRVAIGIHISADTTKWTDLLTDVLSTYELMSQKYFVHATPTLFNAGTPRPQMSSCFLNAMEGDSIEGIYSTLKECALISKYAGGIGLHVHNIRAKGTQIIGTNGTSNGLVPMLQVFNSTAVYCDQCVVPETIIYTMDGPIEIQNCVNERTKVFNLQGNVESIQNVLEHAYTGKLLNIENMHCIENLRITPDHPVYVLTEQTKNTNYSVILNRLQKNIKQLEWVEAKHLKVADFIAYSIPQYFEDISSISEDDCCMYGIVLGDGTLNNNDNKSGTIALHTINKADVLAFARQYFDSKFIPYFVTVDGNTTKIRWNKNVHLPFKYSDCYSENNTKWVHPRWLNLPNHKSKFILKGLLMTDGTVGNEIMLDSTSKNLIESAKFIALKMGVLTSGYVRDRIGETHDTAKGPITNQLISYCLRFPKTQEICDLINIPFDENNFFKFLRFNNFLLSRIKTITEEDYDGTVYDLQMRHEHNYMLHNGLVHNGGGKRKGSFAIYLEPWHADIESFLDLKKSHGDEEMRARDLFYAMWVPDLFMERVKDNGNWSLFCPHECPGLADVYGDAFKELYEKYETTGKAKKTLKARDIWFKVLDAQMETGTPYLCYKDASNQKSNQNNLGTIKSSNLCVASETKVLTDAGEFEIYKLENQRINVWNGEEFSEVVVKKTGVMQSIITVKTRSSQLDCTPYHKFYLHDGTEVEAKHLKYGDSLLPFFGPDGNFVEHIVMSVVDEGFKDDTFCFTEPKRHMGVFNGILTGQCTEIVEFSNENETAVCNLASIALPSFVKEDKTFDYEKLALVTKVVTNNLNKIIDQNFYPTEKCRASNLKHRPIGIGVQGLADTFVLMDLAFHSKEAAAVNNLIFETMYYASLQKSLQLSIQRRNEINCGIREAAPPQNEFDDAYIKTCLDPFKVGAYSSFEDSMASKGILQFDLWPEAKVSGRYDWSMLKHEIMRAGIRNSLLIAPMPTASTSQILGFNECFEPFTSNIYTRRTLAGEFVIVNKYLVKELQHLGLWNERMKNNIIANRGSIQHLDMLPEHVRNKFKTVWEIPMRHVIDMAADRGAFICQSQSMNLWQEDPTYNSLTSMHFYSWKKGLKTGMYYLRRKPKHQAQQFTIELETISPATSADEICEMCSA